MNSSGRMTASPYFSSLVPLFTPFSPSSPVLLKLCSQSYGFLKYVHPREIHWRAGAALYPGTLAGSRDWIQLMHPSGPSGAREDGITDTRTKTHYWKFFLGFCSFCPKSFAAAWSSLGILKFSFTPPTLRLSLSSALRICIPFVSFQDEYW